MTIFRSRITIAAGLSLNVVSVSADYNVSIDDSVIEVDATSGSKSIVLIAATSLVGKIYSIKKMDSSSNSVTISDISSNTIDGSLTYVLATQYQSVTLVSNGTEWSVLNEVTLGASGYSGYSGASGISGFSGYSGISGYSGYSGKSGFSGYSGASGYSGYSGISGQKGDLGSAGSSGFSGYSGSGFSGYSGAGSSGFSGYSGPSGYSGYSGPSGFSGYSGKSGYSGYSGLFGGDSYLYNYAGLETGATAHGNFYAGSTNLSINGNLYFDYIDANGNDLTAWIRALDDSTNSVKGSLRLFNLTAGTFVDYQITGTGIDDGFNTSYRVLVTYVVGTSSFSVNDSIVVIFTRAGDSGISGYSGYSGISGYSGYSGPSGFSGYSASAGGPGTSGYSGYSGISGYSGYSGLSGYSGYSGLSGYSGYSGLSGFSGYSGISGYSGYSGISGYSGYSGKSGYSGYSGPSGFSGYSGPSGFSGYSGPSGFSGYSGISGYSGYSGISGYSGYSGKSGYSGYSGISGYSGLDGSGDPAIYGELFAGGESTYFYDGSGDWDVIDVWSVGLYDGITPDVAGTFTVLTAGKYIVSVESSWVGNYDQSKYEFMIFVNDSGTDIYSFQDDGNKFAWEVGLTGLLDLQVDDVVDLRLKNTSNVGPSITQLSGNFVITSIGGGGGGGGGTSGYSGYSGPSGYSGYSAASPGASGYSGYSGVSGYSGYSGKSGYSGYSGLFGGDSHRYAFNSTPSDVPIEPGSGKLLFDTSTYSAVVQICISDVSSDATITSWLGALANSTSTNKGTIRIFAIGDSSTFVDFTLTSISDNTTFYALAVTYITGHNTFSSNQPIVITFSRTGDSGTSGYSGYSGKSGYSGYSGYSGFSGYSGPSGYSGYSGISGYSGYSGPSGYSGYSGKSGYSGYSAAAAGTDQYVQYNNAGAFAGSPYVKVSDPTASPMYAKLLITTGASNETSAIALQSNRGGNTQQWVIGSGTSTNSFNNFRITTAGGGIDVWVIDETSLDTTMYGGLTMGAALKVGGSAGGLILRARDDNSNQFEWFSATAGELDLYDLVGNAYRWKVTGNGDLKLVTAGAGLYIKEGSNACMGTATLSSGSATVSTTKITASSRVFLTVQSLGTVVVPTMVGVTGRSAGTSFTITSANATDTSVIAWLIMEPS